MQGLLERETISNGGQGQLCCTEMCNRDLHFASHSGFMANTQHVGMDSVALDQGYTNRLLTQSSTSHGYSHMQAKTMVPTICTKTCISPLVDYVV